MAPRIVNTSFYRWLAPVALLVVVALTTILGLWQWGRGKAKDALAEHLAQQPEVMLQGEWFADATVYLDHRSMQGKHGFWVLTPLLTAQHEKAVMVLRGWIPRHAYDPEQLAEIATPKGKVQVHGRMVQDPSSYFTLGKDQGSYRNPAVMSNWNRLAYAKEWNLKLEPLVLRQEGGASEGLLRQWDVVQNTSGKNYAYAVQWFAMAILALLFFLWWLWKKYLKTTLR